VDIETLYALKSRYDRELIKAEAKVEVVTDLINLAIAAQATAETTNDEVNETEIETTELNY
jgi:hypothetical protein